MKNNKNLNPLNDPEVAILLTTILILIMMSVAKSKSKEDWLMEDAEQSECVRRMIKEREKKKAGKAL